MRNTYKREWDLENLFAGGSKSSQFHEFSEKIKWKINNLEEETKNLHTPQEKKDAIQIASIINHISEIQLHISQARSFITCLHAQNTKDQNAGSLRSIVSEFQARFDSVWKKFQATLLKTNDNLWNGLLEFDELKNYQFILNEWRNKAKIQLSDDEEQFVSTLMVDGYYAWGDFYQSLIGSIKVSIPMEGETGVYSVGQAIQLRSHPDERVRRKSHEVLEDIWTEKQDLFAQILNHIAGFRLQVYKKRGNENILEEPLINNRLKDQTLDAMWAVVNQYKQPFIQYLNQKAVMNGNQKMLSYNFWAPVGNNHNEIPFEEAVQFVIKHFSAFGPELEDFTRYAIENGWVESANRHNKAATAFCAGFPLSSESRVFMTYDGKITQVLTLAHELGHAFHNYAMKTVDGLNRQYPMSMAETASTLSELIILNAAIEKAGTKEEKLFLLDEKLKRSVMSFMNIHSRFLFEKKFYEERGNGYISPSRINRLMSESMHEAYRGSLVDISEHSWIWTPHYYLTKSPFYNFPYTFGYLFSNRLYAKFKETGKDFEKNYIELLRDSGRMSTEDLVMKYLGEDITQKEFWEKGMQICVKDVEEFIRLTSNEKDV